LLRRTQPQQLTATNSNCTHQLPSFDDPSVISKIATADLVTIISTESYASCRNCNAKVTDCNSAVVICGKCNAKMKSSKCAKKTFARVILEDDKCNEYKVTIFNDIFNQLIRYAPPHSSTTDVEEQLLLLPLLVYTHNAKDTVTSVTCPS